MSRFFSIKKALDKKNKKLVSRPRKQMHCRCLKYSQFLRQRQMNDLPLDFVIKFKDCKSNGFTLNVIGLERFSMLYHRDLDFWFSDPKTIGVMYSTWTKSFELIRILVKENSSYYGNGYHTQYRCDRHIWLNPTKQYRFIYSVMIEL